MEIETFEKKSAENIIIPDEKNLEKLKKIFLAQGKEKIQVLSDFDKTLTQYFFAGKKAPSLIEQIRKGKYLTPDYAEKAYALFDTYSPYERDLKFSRDERTKKMQEWWTLHFELMIQCGLDKQVLDDIAKKKEIVFRPDVLELIDFLHDNNIPLVIMSAGPGDMISRHFKQEGRLYSNVHIIANFFEFDEKGKVARIKEPIIHSLNKYEIMLQNFPAFNKIKERKNVILLGDGVDDIGMVEGFDYDNLLKIGFLNANEDELRPSFQENFDVIVQNDSDFNYVSSLIKGIVK